MSLTIHRGTSYGYLWTDFPNPVQLDALTSLRLDGDEDFIHGWFKTIVTPALLALHVQPWGFDDVQLLLDLIGAMCGLQHLHLEFESYEGGWSPSTMLTYLDELTDLVTLRFLANVPDCDEPDLLTEQDALNLIQFYPNLRVLAVALASFDFFLQIIELPHLEDLTLHAYFWGIGEHDTGTATCPALRSLRLSGSPSHWTPGPAGSKVEMIPDAGVLKMERFPHLATFEVVAEEGNILGDPTWSSR